MVPCRSASGFTHCTQICVCVCLSVYLSDLYMYMERTCRQHQLNHAAMHASKRKIKTYSLSAILSNVEICGIITSFLPESEHNMDYNCVWVAAFFAKIFFELHTCILISYMCACTCIYTLILHAASTHTCIARTCVYCCCGDMGVSSVQCWVWQDRDYYRH